MIRIATEPFSPEAETAAFVERAPEAGGVVTFLGKVRGKAADGDVEALELQHYPGATEASIARFVAEAEARWPLDGVLVLHRSGRLEPGEPIVLVATASRHRRAAFEAADFLMDYLKSRALFWKREIRADGACWIEPRNADYEDARRWDAASQDKEEA